ncbi:NnrS family protein [Salinarimonas ramus]|uniref:Short-chain dehydrogenase n=1 Tax=Salinarimonas ramus TaxID=690164 RepID=A0A917QHW8_9HYPH|nr:NnrS family protein [Salinarimonas ramus]GGK51551.1 short-chain dehydrogenase [Salinarimonas ramus]
MHSVSSHARRRPARVPHWLTGGFRPFFFLGALAIAASALMWIPVLLGKLALPTLLAPRDWHVHAMLFGGIPALIAGFLLTAVANWTGRKPVAGATLLLLVVSWLAGMIAVSTSAIIGAGPAAAIDMLFPIALIWVVANEIVAARNYRNLRVVGVVALLAIANGAFHYEAHAVGFAEFATRAAVALVLVLVMLIGGRIIPAFTRNWLNARKSSRLPAPFDRTDAATMVVSAAALVLWAWEPSAPATAWLLVSAGVLNLYRLSRWCGLEARREPLLAVLHVGFATIPLGFFTLGGALLVPGAIDPAGALHVWTMGTFGVMTLAVMTRASLGHSGRELRAGKLEIAIFALVVIGFLARLFAVFAGGAVVHVLEFAGLAWALAYLVFAVGYARMLLVNSGAP